MSTAYSVIGCKKGSRECVYPEERPSSKISSSAKNNSTIGACESPESSSDEGEADSEYQPVESIRDEDENFTVMQHGRSSKVEAKSVSQSLKGGPRSQTSEVPSLVQDKGASPTPSTEGSIGYSPYHTVGESLELGSMSSTTRSDWSHLPPDLAYYLTYYYDHITHLHYSLKFDPSNFMKTIFIEIALRDGGEALLHAIVGFAAFQQTLHNLEGRMQDFLQYYNKAVSLLLRSLKRGGHHSIGTLLAILQLATIEVRELYDL